VLEDKWIPVDAPRGKGGEEKEGKEKVWHYAEEDRLPLFTANLQPRHEELLKEKWKQDEAAEQLRLAEHAERARLAEGKKVASVSARPKPRVGGGPLNKKVEL